MSWHTRPSLEEIKDDVLSGRGGLCYTRNVFMMHLLLCLGYEVSFLAASIRRSVTNHILILISNLRKIGDRHLVDVGMSRPGFRPVPLDFRQESPVYKQSFEEFKFKYRGDGKLVQCYKVFFSREWEEFCVIDLTPRDLAYFDECMEEVYGNPQTDSIIFHNSFRASAFSGPGMKFVCIRDHSFFVENESHVLEETKLSSVEEVLKKVDEHFPILSEAARQAVKNIKL